MADIADNAADFQQAEIDRALEQHSRRPKNIQTQVCTDCGTWLGRRGRLGYSLCIDCARDKELKEKGYTNGR